MNFEINDRFICKVKKDHGSQEDKKRPWETGCERECVNRKGEDGMSTGVEWGGIAQASS